MKQFKVDLHMHSNWSDGSQTVGQLINEGKAAGVEVMAITDHDTTEGQGEAIEEGYKQGVIIIPGIEISAFDPVTKRKIHILGYNYSNFKKIEERLHPYLEDRNAAAMTAVKHIQMAGYSIELEEVLAYAGKGGVLYPQHIINALTDRRDCMSTYDELINKLFGTGGAANIRNRYIPVREAVELIKSCNGMAVLAHPYLYNSLGMLPVLKTEGLDGLEAFHPSQSVEQELSIQATASRYGLFITGGSDSHGIYTETNGTRDGKDVFLCENHPLLKTTHD